MVSEDVRLSAAERLRVLNSLPRRHQDYFFEVIKVLCTKHVASLRMPIQRREAEAFELFSEIMAKLLGVTGAEIVRDQAEIGEDALPAWSTSEDPKRDTRVSWLIEQVGGSRALKHRSEDIRRDIYGKWRNDGYRNVQLEPQHVETLSVDPIDPHHDSDMRRVWRGVLLMANSEFEATTDVSILLDLMANDPDIHGGFGAEWPIRQMVDVLNRRHPDPPWDDHRVDNAKKRLKRWIGRLKEIHGLNNDDLMELFARCGRQTQTGKISGQANRPVESKANRAARGEIDP